MSDTVKTYTVQEATVRMERFCAYQERCHKEVVAKLRQMRMIPEAIDLILTHLIEDNYLNEERFARSFARGGKGTDHSRAEAPRYLSLQYSLCYGGD